MKVFFLKIFFVPNISDKPLFLAVFGKKFDKSSEPEELNRRKDARNSTKWPQYNPFEMGHKFFQKIYPQKFKKSIFEAQ